MKRGKGIYFLGFLILISLSSTVSAGVVCQPLDVELVIDQSTSMIDNNKVLYEEAAATSFVNEVSSSIVPTVTNRVGVGAFCSSYWASLPKYKLFQSLKVLPDYQSTLNNEIDSLSDKLCQSTNMGYGLDVAINDLNSNGRAEAKKIIIFMTDGDPNQEGIVNGVLLEPEDYALNRSAEAKRLGYEVYTIGLDIDSILYEQNPRLTPPQARQLLKDMASDPDSTHFYDITLAEAATKLEDVYLEIAQGVTCECGDGIAQSVNGEECDGTDFVPDQAATSLTCSQHDSGYISGSLSCSASCMYIETGCISAVKPTITINAPLGTTDTDGTVNFQATASGSVGVIAMNNIITWKIEITPPSGVAYNVTYSPTSGSALNQNLVLSNGAYSFRIWGQNNYGKWGVSSTNTFTVSVPSQRKWTNAGGTEINTIGVGGTARMLATNINTPGTYAFNVYSGTSATSLYSTTVTKNGANVQDLSANFGTITYSTYLALQDPTKVYFNVTSPSGVVFSSGYLSVTLPASVEQWEHNGIEPTEINLGETVRIIKTNSKWAVGSSHTADIFERDGSLFQPITTVSGTVANDGTFTASWTPTIAQLAPTSDYDHFVFNITGVISDDLKVIVPANFTWRDEYETVITATDIGNPIYVHIANTGLAEGTFVSVNIKEKDSITADDAIKTVTGTIDSMGTFSNLTSISSTDWDNGDDLLEIGEGDTLEFYFEVVGGNPVNPQGQTILTITKATIPPYSKWTDDVTGFNEIDQAEVGDTVWLIVNNSGVVATDPVDRRTFFIKENDLIDDSIGTIVGTVDASGLLVASWKITSDNFSAGDDGTGSNEFFFEVSNQPASGYLNISQNVAEDPFIEIVSPPCGSHFETMESFNLVINSNVDGTITITREGTLVSTSALTIGTMTIPESFSTAGTYEILVEGENSGKHARAITNVMIVDPAVDGKYVAACIDEPKDYSFIDAGSYGIVEFNASSSKGINYTGGNYYDIGKGNLNFSWNFEDGRKNPYISGTDERSYEFFKIFTSVDESWGKLKVVLN